MQSYHDDPEPKSHSSTLHGAGNCICQSPAHVRTTPHPLSGWITETTLAEMGMSPASRKMKLASETRAVEPRRQPTC